jgi:hypothetical protein
MRAFCERNNLLDLGVLPQHLPGLQPLCVWLQKALVAREAAMLYFESAKGIIIETIE